MKRLLSLAALLALLLPTLPAAAQVTGLEGWTVYIDQGHSRTENMGIYGYSEAEKVLRVGLALQELLMETTDIDTAYVARTSDLELVSLSQRTDEANRLGAAWYHSIHSDAGGPSANSTLMLWGQYRNGDEKRPEGGQRMSSFMVDLLTRGYRTTTRGSIGDCSFYGCTFNGPYLHVNRTTTMPSELSEAGFHTNPTQNQRNMNAEWKRLEAYTFYWSILDYFGLERPPMPIVTGFVTDLETGEPINGATVTLDGASYTTDTYASLFNLYSNDPDELRNGFYWHEGVTDAPLDAAVTAPDYAPFEGTVTPEASFFTFFDVQLVSTAAPVVETSAPEAGEEAYPIVASLVFDFSRPMDRAAVEAAFAIAPETAGRFVWANNDTRLVFDPEETLPPQTDFTVTLAGTAAGQFGDLLDGDGDGTGGDDYTLAFRTGFEDFTPPRLGDTYPASRGDVSVELDPVITLPFEEPLLEATVEASRFRLAPASSGSPIPTVIDHRVVAGRSVVHVYPQAKLDPVTFYRLDVLPGLKDLFDNEQTSQQSLIFRTGSVDVVAATAIDAFEDGLADWWEPQQSGSTLGIVTDSTGMDPTSDVVNGLTGSTTAMDIRYGWDVDGGPWLIRTYLSGGAPRAVRFDDTYQLEAYVHGDGSGTLFRFAVDDDVDGSGGHEVSPWTPVDWIGWRRVTWDLAAGETGTWLGDGVLDGTLRFDSFQLSYDDANGTEENVFGRLVVDDLRLVQRSSVVVGTEPGAELPAALALEQNYPNPFNPVTTIRYALPAAGPVTLTVYDLLGREVRRLVDGPQAAGTHEVTFDAAGLPSGAYLYRLQAAGTTRTRTLTVVK